MNPFDLSGPSFLFFYISFSLVVLVGIILTREFYESNRTPRIDLSDPLLIAFLRGGHIEAIRVAVVSLIDRNLLICTGTLLQTAPGAQPASVRRPIEKALLEKFASGGDAGSIFNDSTLEWTLDEYDQTLKKVRLLPDESIKKLRTLIFGGAVFLLGGVGVLKLIIALARGRTNVAFLIILMIVAIVIATKASFPRLTRSGKTMLEDIKKLYVGLKDRAVFLKPGGATIEPMMLAAVFGVGALAGEGFAYTKSLFGRERKVSSSSSSCASAGCGTSPCGSSGGSSCGGSCGGGCGGCGS
jgi:uncharacterized protein (TIGR04222 family)